MSINVEIDQQGYDCDSWYLHVQVIVFVVVWRYNVAMVY